MKKRTGLSWLYVPLILSGLAGCSDGGDGGGIDCPSVIYSFVVDAKDPGGDAISEFSVIYRWDGQDHWQDAYCGVSRPGSDPYQCQFQARSGSLEFEVSRLGYKTSTSTVAVESKGCSYEPLNATVALELL